MLVPGLLKAIDCWVELEFSQSQDVSRALLTNHQVAAYPIRNRFWQSFLLIADQLFGTRMISYGSLPATNRLRDTALDKIQFGVAAKLIHRSRL